MAETLIKPIIDAFQSEWRRSTSFASKTLEVCGFDKSTGVGKAVNELNSLSSLRKFPLKAEAFFSSVCEADRSLSSARKIVISGADMVKVGCNFIGLAHRYGVQVLGYGFTNSEVVSTTKLIAQITKSTFNVWSDCEELRTPERRDADPIVIKYNRQISYLKLGKHGLSAASKIYRVTILFFKWESNTTVLKVVKLAGIIFDISIVVLKEERKACDSNFKEEKPKKPSSILELWGNPKDVTFIKYGTSATLSLLDRVGLTDYNPKEGLGCAAANYYQLFKLKLIFEKPKKICEAIVFGSIKEKFKETTGAVKYICTMLLIANKFGIWVPYFARFESSKLSTAKIGADLLNFGVNVWDAGWRISDDSNKTPLSARITTFVGFSAVEGVLFHLNYVKWFEKKTNPNLLLFLSVTSVVCMIAAAKLSIDRPSKSSDS